MRFSSSSAGAPSCMSNKAKYLQSPKLHHNHPQRQLQHQQHQFPTMTADSLFDLALGGKKAIEEEDKVPVTQENNRYQHSTCGQRCFAVTAVALFLFLTFVALPGGSFLIIHGRHENSLPFLLGGAAVVCLPILAGIILLIVFCIRRHRRKATFTSVNNAPRV